MIISISPKPPRRGSSLLLVLWAIMLMSFAVIGLVKNLSRGLDESIAEEKEFRARLLLDSARAVAAHPGIERGDPLLQRYVSSATSYEVHLSTEGARLAVNTLATSRPQRAFAERLFEKWGMDARDSVNLVDSIADWIDADATQRTQGAEREVYTALDQPDKPFNKPFETLEDILMVRGADVMDRLHPSWRDAFTLYGDGTIDVHTASGEILEALLDVTGSEVSRFLRARNGPDGIAETEDDPRYTGMEQVGRILDVPQRNFRRASFLLTLNHPIRRTELLARAGNLERRLTILSGPGIYLINED